MILPKNFFQDCINLNEGRFDNKDPVYIKDNVIYKIWDELERGYLPFCILDGLDLKHMGCSVLASMQVNLINFYTCPAFKELIYDEKGNCVGYSMFQGNLVDPEDLRLLDFSKTLVKHTLSTGYLYRDIDYVNMIEYKNKISLIDINFIPVNLFHTKKMSVLAETYWSNFVFETHTEKHLNYYYPFVKSYVKKHKERS